jgi:hypothetical protein
MKLSLFSLMLFFTFIGLQAQQIVDLPLSGFSFSNSDKYILDGEGSVIGDCFYVEMSKLILEYKILSKEKDSTQDISLIVKYDDRLSETITKKISPTPKKGSFTVELKHSSGRMVKSIQITGLNKRVDIQFFTLKYEKGPKAFTLEQSVYLDAGFADNEKSEDGLLYTYRPINGPPYITRLKHNKIKLIASATGENPEAIKDGSVLVLTAIAADKSWMEDYKIKITDEVKEYDFEIKGHDVSKGIILIFQADLNQPDIAIRRIIVQD